MHGHGVDLSPKKSKIAEIAEISVKWIRENRRSFFAIVGVVVVVLFILIVMLNASATKKENASNSLASAFSYLAAGNGAAGINQLDATISGFPRTPAAYQARLLKSDILVSQRNFDGALVLLQETLANGRPSEVRPLALVRIISIYDQQKDYANAVFYSNEFIRKYKNHFLAKNIYLNLAQFYMLQGDMINAARVFNEIMTSFPGSNEAYIADTQLKSMQK